MDLSGVHVEPVLETAARFGELTFRRRVSRSDKNAVVTSLP
jgi:hypothetical protein